MNIPQEIAINLIDSEDSLYCIHSTDEHIELLKSMQVVGLLSPIYVQDKGNNTFRIVSGFRRVAAAQALGMETIPAFVIAADEQSLTAFFIQLYDNLAARPFKPSEIVTILFKFAQFGCSREEIIKTWLPRLGFGKNPRVFDLYNSLHGLEPEWLQALDEDQVALDMLATLANADLEDRTAFYTIVQELKPGKNNQREFWALCADIARIKHTTIAGILSHADLNKIIADKVLSSSQKSERFKQTLWELRYPHYMQAKTQFQALLKKAKLPPDVQVNPSPYFDDSACTVSFVFRGEQDYNEKLELLQSMSANGIICEINGLVR